MTLPPRTFLAADLNVRGELQLKAEYQYALLERIPGAAELIGQLSGALWRSPSEFEEAFWPERPGSSFRWCASSETAGIATLRCDDQLVSISFLVCGVSDQQDSLTLMAFQTHLLRELRDTGYEPAFALMDLAERPLVATINFTAPAHPADQKLAALVDRCFAASYFRFQGLA